MDRPVSYTTGRFFFAVQIIPTRRAPRAATALSDAYMLPLVASAHSERCCLALIEPAALIGIKDARKTGRFYTGLYTFAQPVSLLCAFVPRTPA